MKSSPKIVLETPINHNFPTEHEVIKVSTHLLVVWQGTLPIFVHAREKRGNGINDKNQPCLDVYSWGKRLEKIILHNARLHAITQEQEELYGNLQ